LERKGCDHVKS
jgi:hypothetical protein